MATNTTYSRDKCGKEQDTRDQIWSVCVHISSDQWPVVTSSSYWTHKKDWCRGCVEEFGMLPRVVLKDKPIPVPALTLEDMLREIVREEVESTRQ